MSLQVNRSIAVSLLVLSAAALAGCVAPSQKQLAMLRSQVATERESLAAAANPYRIKNSSASMELHGKPLNDLLTDFNRLPPTKRFTFVRSTATSGHLKYHKWFSCPWPLDGNASWFIDLTPSNSLIGALALGEFDYSWAGPEKFNFGIRAGAALAGFAVFYVDNCFWTQPTIPLWFEGFATEKFSGRLLPVATDTGAEFKFDITSPRHITVFAHINGLPFWLNLDTMDSLGALELDNIVGKKGKLKFGNTAVCRDYQVDATTKNPRVLEVGLAIDSDVKLVWAAPGDC
jgi:hypothetical protein